VNGIGDGNTEPDWEVVSDHLVRLRAERAGPRSGRIYTITITSTDDCGNSSSQSVTVQVAHDQGGRPELTTIRPGSEMNFTVLPNPARRSFTLRVNTVATERIVMQVMDQLGRIVEMKVIAAGYPVSFGEGYRSGSYYVRIIQGNEIQTTKIVKLSD
jgi:hypothetical protein